MSSDPGTSALLTPQCETHGLYFNDEHEPENFKYVFDKDIHENIVKKKYDVCINGPFNSMEDYFNFHVGLMDYDDIDNTNIRLVEVAEYHDVNDDIAEDNRL